MDWPETPRPPALAQLQQWLHHSITHPTDVTQGAAEASAMLGAGIQELIQPSSTLNAGDRLAIYRNAYFLRLMGVLNAEYPALKLALGDALFDKFALFFLQQQPPASHTLYQLSARFPDFLEASIPPEEDASGWPAFIVDVARLERTFQEVYRAPGTEGQARQEATAPRPAPCLRLMAARYPVHAFLVAARKEQTTPWPQPCATWLAICRRDYRVAIHALNVQEYNCLREWPPSRPEDFPLKKWMDEGLLV
ncbi:MAG: DNA-binding domain-containing protein [Duganella sp.]